MSSGHIIVHANVIAKAEHFDKVKEGESRRSKHVFASFILVFSHCPDHPCSTPAAMVKIREYALNQEEGTLVYRTSISKDNERKIEIFEEVSRSVECRVSSVKVAAWVKVDLCDGWQGRSRPSWSRGRLGKSEFESFALKTKGLGRPRRYPRLVGREGDDGDDGRYDKGSIERRPHGSRV